MTAVDRVDCHRIDHQGFVPEIYAGLLATSLYMMQVGPIIETLSDRIEDWIAIGLFAGALTCLVGVVLGTKWFFKSVRRKTSYIVQLFGLPLIIASLGFLTYTSVDSEQLVLTALGGGLGLVIEIGAVRLMVDLIDDLNENHEGHGHD